MTAADLLAGAFGFAAPQKLQLVDVPEGTRCAVSGVPIRQGYNRRGLQPSSLSDAPDIFRGGEWVGPSAAACLSASSAHLDNRASRAMFAVEGAPGMLPMISRESAREQGRPCWSELIRQAWPTWAGFRFVAVLSTSTKRRVWPAARVSVIGERCCWYVHDEELCVSARLLVDWPALVSCLEIFERVYSAGVGKQAIATSVLSAVNRFELGQLMEWERWFRPWRHRPEFVIARLVAQKKEDAVEVQATRQDTRAAAPRSKPRQPSRRREADGQQQLAFQSPGPAPRASGCAEDADAG